MSTVALPESDFRSKLTVDDLRLLASKYNITVEPGSDESAYLTLLQSAEAVYEYLQDSEDYIHPALKLTSTVQPRQFQEPVPERNVLNAWSHQCEIRGSNPDSDLLKGRTIALKDNISVGGLPTTIGTRSGLVSDTDAFPISVIDATIVSRVLGAGAIIKGTATCETYSVSVISSTSYRGPVQNPWVHGFSAGGSSSGSAALIGANAVKCLRNVDFGDTVDLAIGGDQGGSIRLPAAYNGCYGLKPTHGLVPYSGVMSLSPMVDHVGPITNNLEDIATLLKVLAGYDGIDARMTAEAPQREQVPDYPSHLAEAYASCQARPQTDFTVGLLRESFAVSGMDPVMADHVFQSASKAFRAMGVKVVEISVPMHTEGPLIWTAATRASMSDWAVAMQTPGYLTYQPPHMRLQWPPNQDMYETLSDTNPTVMNLVFCSSFLKEKYGPGIEARAHRKIFALRQAYDQTLSQVDVLITPTTIGLASKHPELKREGKRTTIMERMNPAIGLSSNTCPFNATGHPALSVPCGLLKDESTGDLLPVGMQIVGKRWDESTVLKAAAIFEVGQQCKESTSMAGQPRL